MNDFNIVKDSTELRKLIAENPELPIVVMVGEEATSSDYYWTYCSDLRCVVKVLCSGKTLDGFCQCEACGDVFPLAYSEYNYCPNCGARMDLKEGDAE